MHEEFDKRCKFILVDAFKRTSGSVKGINAKRFRADHYLDIERIEMMINKMLLYTDTGQENLWIGPIGLYFLHTKARDRLVADINLIWEYLGKHYAIDGEQRIRLADISKTLDMARNRVEECISHILRARSLSVSGNLLDEDAFIETTETFLRYKKFEDYLGEQAIYWIPEAFAKKQSKAKPHGNTEVHARKREEVLRAAITAIVNWPDACKTGDSFNGTAIAKLIEQKAALWWKEGEAPLATEVMTRLINNCLKLPE